MSQPPHDAPPSYYQATGTLSQSSASGPSPDRLTVPPRHSKSRNGILPSVRRSMEDELRPMPEGWVRQFDTQSQHQFYVDTRAKSARSIWHHPYDDEQYLESLSPAERQRIASIHNHNLPSQADLMAESTDEEDHYDSAGSTKNSARPAASGAAQPPLASQSQKKESLRQKMKDKLTGTSHEQREQERQQRAEAEQRAYERHRAIRQAMMMAQQTGQPQLAGQDGLGHDIYIEPPGGPRNINAGYPGWAPGTQQSYNPYATHPAYSNPNARFIRPDYGYQRPYGRGYGGGLGLPIAGGLLGGMMLGGMLGGF